jgi:hypothetical protein
MLESYVPTRLYIKRHTKTGLRYLGKTIHEDVAAYKGSGKRWTNHLKRHGKEFVINEWVSDWFNNPHDLQEFALLLSETLDVVDSSEWANLKPEYGIEGNRPIGKMNGMYGSSRGGAENPFYGKSHSDDTKKTISQKKTGIKMSDDFRAKRSALMSSDANPMCDPKNRKTLSEARLKTPKKECAHCGVYVDPGNYGKSHGDKCKKKPKTDTGETLC